MRTTRQQAVVDQLRDAILRGNIEQGARMFEIPLSEQLQVSRTPIREALITLSEEGLVEYRPNRGYIVRSFNIDSIMDAYVVRETLESLACRLLAEKGISDEIDDEFKAILAEGDRILSVDRLTEQAREPWGEINNRFHSLIINGAGNVPLTEAWNRISNIPYASSRVVHWFSEDDIEGLYQLRAVHAQHHAIVNAVRARQGHRAEVAMRGHIDFAANHIRARYIDRAEERQPADARGAKAEGAPRYPALASTSVAAAIASSDKRASGRRASKG